MKTFLIFLFSLFISNVYSQTLTVIKGQARSYAGDKLTLCCYSDPITMSQKVIAESFVDTAGNFRFEINTKKTFQTFIPLYVFKGILYIEPNQTYEIILPDKTLRNKADSLDPMFSPAEFYISFRNSTGKELNSVIKKFDKILDISMQKQFRYFRGNISKIKIDSMIQYVENQFVDDKNPFFETYRYYQYAAIRNVAYIQNRNDVIKQFYSKKPVQYENSSYFSLFNQLFDRYFINYSESSEGQGIVPSINEAGSLQKLKNSLSQDKSLKNDTLKELVILKSLYEIFYSKNFQQANVLSLLDSIGSQTKIAEHREIVANMKRNIPELLVGKAPPDFELLNQDSVLVRLSSLRGRFYYLNFAHTENYSALQQLKLMDGLTRRKNPVLMLEMVTIVANGTFAAMRDFVKKNGYKWTFLYAGEKSDVLKRYNVKIFPTFYLINPQGILSRNPASSLTENFEVKYFHILKSWEIEQIRKK